MSRIALAILFCAALVVHAGAQKREEPRGPGNVFFRTQQPSQYLARERLIGSQVVDKDGQALGTIDDLIIGSGGQIEGVILGVGGYFGWGEKKIGVRMSALRITTADGKTTIAFPSGTKEMLAAADAYQRATAPPPAKK
jgi:hypothetical protein